MSVRNYFPQQLVKQAFAELICASIQSVYERDASEMKSNITRAIMKPKVGNQDLGFPCFSIGKLVGVKNPSQIASALGADIKTRLADDSKSMLSNPCAAGAFINCDVSVSALAETFITDIDSFLAPRPADQQKVMIEYSQPNTHKAFHVGHMRNCALGGALVHMYEQAGHPVVAANYFGDEGNHIAQCLWLLRQQIANGTADLKSVEPAARGEFLGQRYSDAVQILALESYTTLPFPDMWAAQVLEVSNHPDSTAPANWHVVKVQHREATEGDDGTATVVCGGTGYNVGDIIAYVRVGGKYKGHDVTEKDMKGVTSCGVIMGRAELGLPAPPKPVSESAAPAEKKEEKKSKKKKKGKGGKAAVSMDIHILPPGTAVGKELTEIGRINEWKTEEGKAPVAASLYPIPPGRSIADELKERKDQVRAMLVAMESGEPEITALWEETKKWSLDEFASIYGYLRCRFDHNFYESEVGEESRQLVISKRDEGILTMDRGAIVADLTEYKLGHLVLLKSSGAGLYATKDLSLAQRKFEQFNVDKSIYVVDIAQSLHFQQCFKVLELFGYEQARNCYHMAYGQVVLPNGKMSSRKGTVIFFSQLKAKLSTQIYQDYCSEYEGKWPAEEITEAVRALSVAIIKYGMLNHDVSKDVVFDLNQWCAKGGNNGAYIMYSYARCASIQRQVPVDPDAGSSLTELQDSEKTFIHLVSIFWEALDQAITKNNPSVICAYLFNLCQAFNQWYNLDASKVSEQTPARRNALLVLVNAIRRTIQVGLGVIGIQTIERM
jgi:arginyl-tRNA synthetase